VSSVDGGGGSGGGVGGVTAPLLGEEECDFGGDGVRRKLIGTE
jgi:hypothetical protein